MSVIDPDFLLELNDALAKPSKSGLKASFENVDAALLVAGATVLDEDDMASDSATQPPSQQSTKAYVDASAGSLIVTNDAADYSTQAYVIAASGARGVHVRFTGATENEINFPVSVAANSYGWVENASGADMDLTWPSGVTVNGVAGADSIPFYGLVYWVRDAADSFRLYGAVEQELYIPSVIAGHSAKLYSTTGTQTLNKATFRAGSVLRHTGGAATYQCPARPSVSGRAETLVIWNDGSGDVTLSASGTTFIGNTIVPAGGQATVHFFKVSTTDYVRTVGAQAA